MKRKDEFGLTTGLVIVAIVFIGFLGISFVSFWMGFSDGENHAESRFESQEQNLTLEARNAALTEVAQAMLAKGSRCEAFEVTFNNQTLHFVPTECIDAALRQIAAVGKE